MTKLLQSNAFVMSTGFLLLVLVGVVDYILGYEITFSLFYFVPIFLVTWLSGKRAGLLVALLAAGFWVFVDLLQDYYSRPYAPYLNLLIRSLVFMIVVWLLDALKRVLDKERDLARVDYLTGAASRLAYFEMLEMELSRSKRYGHPFVVAYVDLDNFKEINDTKGHEAGDDALCRVASSLREGVRETDVVARLGGDEFALLLPEMDEKESKVVFPKLRARLLEEMGKHQWPVTFSIGVLVCEKGVSDAEQLVKMADELMYEVKRGGKNAVSYAVARGD